MFFPEFSLRRPVLLVAGVSMLAFQAALPALAADVVVTSKIEAVTVFPDAAQVSRVAEVDVPAGASSIIFKGLPYRLDTNSLRVQAVGDSQLLIASVAARVEPAAQSAASSSFAEKLRALVNERNLSYQKLRALQAKKTMIERYAKATPEKLGEKSAPMNVADWDKAWSAVGDGLAKVAEEIQAIQLRQRELGQEINALRRSHRGTISGSQPRRSVAIDVEAGSSGKTRLRLIYRVSGASWRPVYDARLETGGKTGKPSLELIRRASVRQRTGEDWSGVALTVSTVRASRGTQAPNLLAQRLEFYNPPPAKRIPLPAPVARDQARKNRPAGGLLSTFSGRARAAKPAQERAAVVVSSGYDAAFRIPGKIDLKGDNSTRILQISSSKIVPELMVRAVPAMDATAYLEAAFVNKDEAPILPGIVNIHRDGSYAGRGRFKLVAPADKAVIGLGADDSVKIKRVPVSRKQSGPGWIGNNRSAITAYTTSVTNLHGFDVKVRILDRIPISEDDKIVIKPQPGNTTASEKNVDGRRGVLAWVFELKPRASKKISLGWQVEWPNGKRVVPRSLPN